MPMKKMCDHSQKIVSKKKKGEKKGFRVSLRARLLKAVRSRDGKSHWKAEEGKLGRVKPRKSEEREGHHMYTKWLGGDLSSLEGPT